MTAIQQVNFGLWNIFQVGQSAGNSKIIIILSPSY
jgi:hypothetical protein